jgi:hypothetical protein
LKVLLDRLRNEVTRLAAVKAFTIIATSPLNLSLDGVVESVQVSFYTHTHTHPNQFSVPPPRAAFSLPTFLINLVTLLSINLDLLLRCLSCLIRNNLLNYPEELASPGITC